MADRIDGLSIGLSLDTIKVDSGLQSLKSKLSLVNSEMKTNMSAFDRGEKSLSKYQTQLGGLNKKLEVQKAVTDAAQKNYEKMVKTHGEGSQEAEKAATHYNNQAASLNNLERYIGRVTDEMKQFAEAQKVADSGFTKFGDKMQAAGSKITAVGGKMKSAGKDMSMYVTAPLVGFGAIAAKTGIDFGDSMAKVQATSGASGKEMDALREKAKAMGATTKFSASDSADALNYMALAGWDSKQMIDGLGGVMDLAAASGEDLASVSDIVTDGLSAFGLQAKDSGRMADVLAASSSNANTDVAGLGESFKYVAPVAGALGFTIEDTSKAIGLMANAGIKGSQSGTSLRTMMTNLAKPTAGMKKEMDKLGISLTDSDGKMKTFDVIMGDLRKSFGGLDEAQQANSAATIFGKEAMSGALAIVNASESDYDKLGNAINNSGGKAKEMAEIMEGTLGGSIREIKSALEGFAISIFEEMEPALDKFATGVKNVVDWLNDLSPSTKRNIVIIGGLVAAIGPVLVGLGTLAASLGAIITFVGSVSTAIGIMGTATAAATPLIGGLATVFGALSWPLVGAVAGIAALGIGAVALGNHLKKDAIPEVDHFGSEVSESTKKALGGFMDLNDGAVSQLTDMRIRGGAITKESAGELKETFSGMNAEILNGLKKNHADQITEMELFFKNSAALPIAREKEILEKQKESNAAKEKEVQRYETRALEIIDKASKEKRELTQFEQDELDAIRKIMADNAIKHLTDNERDQKIILERMKSETGKVTAQQAAETVKNSKEATDKVIKDANKTYSETIGFAIQQRDEAGAISAEEAQMIIDDAKAKYKESTKKAKDTHKEVVDSAKLQAKEHVAEVDWETGEVLSKWEVYKIGVKQRVGDTKKDTIEHSKQIFDRLKSDAETGLSWIGTKWENYKTSQKKRHKEMKEDALKDMGALWEGTKNLTNKGVDHVQRRWGDHKRDVTKAAKDIKDNTTKYFSEKWTNLKTSTSNGVSNIKSGYEGMRTGVTNTVSNLSTGVKTRYNDMKNNLITKTTQIKVGISDGFNNARLAVIDMTNKMKTKALDVFTGIVSGAKGLPGRMKDAIVSMASEAVNGMRNVGNKMASMFGSVVNGLVKGLNSITSKLGVSKKVAEWKVPQFHAGTDGTKKDGLMVVGDKYGREIVEFPNGKSFVSPDTDTLLHAPKGTKVIPNHITEKYLSGEIPHFAKGAGVKEWVKEKASSFKNALSNIWDHVSNPGKLIEMMGLPSLKDATGGFGDIIKGASSKVREGAVSYIKSMFASAEQPGGGGAYNYGSGPGGAGSGFPGFGYSSGYGWRIHPISKKRKFHNGDDYPAPYGKAIPNQVAGKVVRSERGKGAEWPRGLFVQVRSGNMDRVYQHNSRNSVRVGQQVARGQTVGHVGSTGSSTGNHLHYEVWRNGRPINPRGLATGGRVDQPIISSLGEEGTEFVIPTGANRRTSGMKLLALAAKALGGGDKGVKRPNQLGGNSGGGVFEQMLAATMKQNEILLQLLHKNTDIYMDSEAVGRLVTDTVSGTQYDNSNIHAVMNGVRF